VGEGGVEAACRESAQPRENRIKSNGPTTNSTMQQQQKRNVTNQTNGSNNQIPNCNKRVINNKITTINVTERNNNATTTNNAKIN